MRTPMPIVITSLALTPAVGPGFGWVFSQPTTTDDSKVGLGWYSNAEPRVLKNYKHADDFVLTASAEIGRVVWWGQSSLHSHDDLTNFDSFEIEIYEARLVDGEWMPGAVIAERTLDLAATNPAPTGRLTPAGAIEYRHDAVLGTPIELGADTRYFIAIAAGLIATGRTSDAWQWQDADLHDGWSATYSWAAGTWTGYQDSDSAFELYAVPAPATAAPLCAAAAALAGRRRR